MSKPRTVVLVAKGERNRQVLGAQLNDLLRGRVEVRSLCVDVNFSPSLLEGDLIVVASEPIRRDLAPYFTGRSNVIVARRTIDLRNLHLLLKLPPYTKIMLVNDRRETAEEAISLLYSMGFTDYWFIPVYPGLENVPQVDIAVTPGEPQLVPPGVKQVVDLGCRIIDVTTLIEILLRLDLLDEKAHLLSARYLNYIIEISKKLVQSLKDNQELNLLLTTILDKVHDGVMAIDASGKTFVYNRAAERFFRYPAKQVLGRRLEDIIPQISPEKPLRELKSEENVVESYAGRRLLVNRTLLKGEDNQPQGVIITFNELDTLEKIERRLKAYPGATGYVAKYTFEDLRGEDPVFLECLEKAKHFASTDLPVLILGATGTGKELLAHAIHNASPRHSKPFIAVNCAALPKDLLESELFGYEEGAFTGARRGGRAGLFEQANGGSIFLDEIGDLPFNLQAKLLRVLEQKEVMRLGAERVIPIDVRILAATSKDVKEAVDHGEFRLDLYYRLNAFTVRLPSLKERQGDIPILISYFLQKHDREPHNFFTSEALKALMHYPWPGNIRELRNTIEYLVTVSGRRQVKLEDLPVEIREYYWSSISSHERKIIKGGESPRLDFLKEIGELYPQIKIDVALLEILAESPEKALGRQALLAALKNRGWEISEDIVRTRIKELANQKLVIIGKTRQGTKITFKGEKWLNQMRDLLKQ